MNLIAQRRWLATTPTILVSLLVLCPLAFAAQVSEVGDGFGYNADVMTGHDGLSYQFRPDGTIKVMRDSETLSFIGLGVNGRVASGWITKYVTDFAWSWVHSVDAEGNHYFNSSVVQTGFDWYANVSFAANPALKMKVAYGFKNKLGEAVTNIRLFYLETLDNGATLRYNNRNYTVSWAETSHFTNDSINLTAVVPRIGFPGFWAFDYSDLISDNFKITDFFAGNASEFDSKLPAKIVVVVAMTKGNGVLPNGATEWADPTIIQTSAQANALYNTGGRHLLVTNTSCGPVYHAVWQDASYLWAAQSFDNGTTWLYHTALNWTGGVTWNGVHADATQNGDLHVIARSGASVYYVNGTKNATCGWSFSVGASVATAGTYPGSGASVYSDWSGNLWLSYPLNNVVVSNSSVKVCRTGSNCSVAANWNASNNSAGYDEFHAELGVNSTGAGSFVQKNVDELYYLTNDAYSTRFCHYRKTGAGAWTADSFNTKDCVEVSGASGYFIYGASAAVNSTETLFVLLTAAFPPRTILTLCSSGCNDSASNWKAYNGSTGFTVLTGFYGVGTVGVLSDKPFAAFINHTDFNYWFDGSLYNASDRVGTPQTFIAVPASFDLGANGSTRSGFMGVNGSSPYSLTFYDLNWSGGGAAAGGGGVNQSSETYSAVAYETNASLFNSTLVYDSAILTFANASLVYNGSEYATNATDNGSTVYFNRTHELPFLSGSNSNNTALNFYWSTHFTYANASEYVWNSTTRTQNLWFAWFLDAWTVAPTNLLAGQQALSTLNTSQVTGYSATVSARISWAGTNYSLTVDGFNFTRWNTASAYSIIFGAVGWLNVTYGSLQRINMTTNVSITVISPGIVACNATANQTIFNFTVRDEESNVSVNFSMDATFWLWNSGRTINTTYSANWTNVLYAEACIYPNWAAGVIDSFQNYYSTVNGTSQRSEFLWNVSVSNASTLNYTLFALAASITNQTIFSVQDQTGLKVDAAIVKVLRYFPATNQYVNVAELITDFEGKGTTYLRVPDTYYRFVVEKNGVTLLFSSPSIITCVNEPYCPPYSVALVTNPFDVAGYWKVVSSVAVSCSLTEATRYYTCLVGDPNSVLASVNLLVTQATDLNESVVCNLTETTFPAVLPCYLGANLTGNVYWAWLQGRSVDDNSLVLLDPTPFDFRELMFTWGLAGVLAAMMIVVTMYFLGSFNPSVAIVAAYVGLVASWMLNLIPLGTSGIELIIGVGVVVGLLAWKMRT